MADKSKAQLDPNVMKKQVELDYTKATAEAKQL